MACSCPKLTTHSCAKGPKVGDPLISDLQGLQGAVSVRPPGELLSFCALWQGLSLGVCYKGTTTSVARPLMCVKRGNGAMQEAWPFSGSFEGAMLD